MLLLYHTGFRVNEILSLKVGDVLQGRAVAAQLTVDRRHLKGGTGVNRRTVRSRTVALHPILRATIQTFLTELAPDGNPAPERFLFASREGGNRPIHYVQAYRILRAASASIANPARVSLHSWRKSFVRAVYENSHHDLVLTSRAVGHRSIVTTMRYLETCTDEVDTAVLSLPHHGLTPPPAIPKSDALSTHARSA